MSDGEERERNRELDRLIVLFQRRQIGRREFLTALAALGVSAAGAGLLAACGGSPTATATTVPPTATSAPASKPITPEAAATNTPAPVATPTAAALGYPSYKADPTVVAAAGKVTLLPGNWGGSWSKCFDQYVNGPFTEDTGIKVQEITPLDYGKIRSMVDANSLEYWFFNGSIGARAAAEGYSDPLDYKIITNSKDVYDQALVKPNTVPADVEVMVLGYQKSKWPDPATAPKTWADFWNVDKFPGTRSLQTRVYFLLEFALLADGVDKLTYPLDVDRAFKSLDKIKPNIKLWWDYNTQAQSQQLMKDGEVDMINILNGRLGPIIKDGANVDMSWENAVAHNAVWCIIKGAPNQELINRYINFAIAPKPAGGLSNCTGYGSPNAKSTPYLDPAIMKFHPSNPDHAKFIQTVDMEWWAKNEGPIQERFDAWRMA